DHAPHSTPSVPWRPRSLSAEPGRDGERRNAREDLDRVGPLAPFGARRPVRDAGALAGGQPRDRGHGNSARHARPRSRRAQARGLTHPRKAIREEYVSREKPIDAPNPEWQRKGATLSDKTARKEFGLTQEEIVQAIRDGKLCYRLNSIYGNPFLRLLRREVEALVE